MHFVLLLFCLCCSAAKACTGGETCPQEEQCDLDIRCPRVDDGDSAVLIPHADCSKFYKCASGRTCVYRCPANLHFNPVELACDRPEKACCDRSQPCNSGGHMGLTYNLDYYSMYSTNSNNSNLDYYNIYSTYSNHTNQIKPPTINNLESINQPITYSNDGSSCFDHNQCPLNDNPNDPVALPSTSCQQFYKCSLGKACLLSCPTGLHFNQQTKYCDYPEIACCDRLVPCTGSIHISTNCQNDTRCPIGEDPNNPTHLPHSNCGMFYKCSYGKACELPCPQGQHFSPVHNRCEYPTVACCDPSIPCSTAASHLSPQNPSAPQNPSVPQNPSAPQVWTDDRNTIQCNLNSRCGLSNEKKNIYLRHASCSKYYQCNGGRACEFQCPQGLHFNEREKVCQWPQYAACSTIY
ncbi:probable chitinase 10 [Wyeomyia smithii]|uniref:probable chitinase 10 n=1 Tax=Wyeomyia smithii TaxID=174621 RepID=UPI002467D808|nr:probable chitinase 10 [Wyeomyia smithii]